MIGSYVLYDHSCLVLKSKDKNGDKVEVQIRKGKMYRNLVWHYVRTRVFSHANNHQHLDKE